ncbi:DNA mismatch repair endonuclease MutL [Parashewanella curva]|uniref:DNA mismatch repair protein MutL n=1 Tax=Parashewanella curva TaxID=2338552 RepID=A0A3L8Q2S3_9GAMM|nr:DNA mismatch repair endonuclease MutL [Parashewanella curva]RLV61318.1 DNA mismatch repair endonuclease MutL [Parashewanella curva]
MPIQILPPQLANQIAAGEVVERPASVVKELVENCLDAGASRVDIEIEKGGAKLIRIRDNGCGIAKEQLELALARHATSKVTTLDDLEAIMSFGFRGEALASISSVARLTLTSKTEEQSEAWQAYAEGSQMAVKVIPAAHPVGTTIEVHDLFFNTPARRRFLKSDKTEFTHIDEWLKRMALVRSDIHFTLQHNGKMVRNYRPASNESQYIKRLGQVASNRFAEHAVAVDCEHDGMRLRGYLQSPTVPEPSLNMHYFYVNGRYVRDRLVNHAVRQAFGELSVELQPNYVLQFDLDPHQVDVNVHPAKHEVRFHQSRYVHDFILQALQSALSQLAEPIELDDDRVNEESYIATHFDSAFDNDSGHTSRGAMPNSGAISSGSGGGSRLYQPRYYSDQLNVNAVKTYADLLSTNESIKDSAIAEPGVATDVQAMPPLLDGEYWLFTEDNHIKLLEVKKAALLCNKLQITQKLATGLVPQPLLMPVSITQLPDWPQLVDTNQVLLRKLGLELTFRAQQLIIKKVPSYLRDCQLVEVIPMLLQWLQSEQPADEALVQWLAEISIQGFVSAKQVWLMYLQLTQEQQKELHKQAIDLPWQRWLNEH